MFRALQFHRIIPEFQICGTWNTPRQFEGFLRLLNSSGLNVGLPGEPGVDLVITFDDGEENAYQYAFPLLKKYSMKAVIFLIAGYIGRTNCWDLNFGRKMRHLDWPEIREMRDYGIEFGSHGLNHVNLTRLADEVLFHELDQSKRIIESELGACRCLSYPFNRFDRRVLGIASDIGYKYGFGGDGSSPLSIKKEAIYITDTRTGFRVKLHEHSPLYAYERMKQKIINIFTLVTMLSRPVKHMKGD